MWGVCVGSLTWNFLNPLRESIWTVKGPFSICFLAAGHFLTTYELSIWVLCRIPQHTELVMLRSSITKPKDAYQSIPCPCISSGEVCRGPHTLAGHSHLTAHISCFSGILPNIICAMNYLLPRHSPKISLWEIETEVHGEWAQWTNWTTELSALGERGVEA